MILTMTAAIYLGKFTETSIKGFVGKSSKFSGKRGMSVFNLSVKKNVQIK